MTNNKVALLALLSALVLIGPVFGQDLDGTLKKIKTSGTFTIGYREGAPPTLFGAGQVPVGSPLTSAWRSRAPFKSSWGWRISSSTGCR